MSGTVLSTAEARAFHDEVVVFDLHADTPKLLDVMELDLGVRHDPPPRLASYVGHVDLPRMIEGGLGAQIFGMWTLPYPARGCAASVHRQLDALDAAIAAYPGALVRCWSGDDVRAARQSGRIAALSGIEGGQALEGSLDELDRFAARGVRSIGLLHFSANAIGRPAFGVGASRTAGLSDFGREVIARANELGVLVDLAHISRAGFFEAAAASRDPVVVTHTGVAGVHRRWRNIDDEQIRAVADSGGVVGILFAPQHLGRRGIDGVCQHILHVLDVAGEDAPALGSDYDGFVVPARGLEDVSRLPALTQALAARGLPLRVLAKILGENALRVLDAVPPRARPAIVESAAERADRGGRA
jgi:membrane dipeptidase